MRGIQATETTRCTTTTRTISPIENIWISQLEAGWCSDCEPDVTAVTARAPVPAGVTASTLGNTCFQMSSAMGQSRQLDDASDWRHEAHWQRQRDAKAVHETIRESAPKIADIMNRTRNGASAILVERLTIQRCQRNGFVFHS